MLKSPAQALDILKKEYLKMNRLTQKIVNHIMEFIEKTEDDQFMIFLIRVIFGEQIERKICFKKIKNEFREDTYHFKEFVKSHLKAAEKLTKHVNYENKKSNDSEIKVINNRLGNVLFPPERVIRFNSILGKSTNESDDNMMENNKILGNLKTKESLKLNQENEKSFQEVFPHENKYNKLPGELFVKNQLIIPTARRATAYPQPLPQNSLNSILSPEHKETIHYLESQIYYYQNRIKNFYYSLKNYQNKHKNSIQTNSPRESFLNASNPRDRDLNISNNTQLPNLGKRSFEKNNFSPKFDKDLFRTRAYLSMKKTKFSSFE
jgi:hypothetical protein